MVRQTHLPGDVLLFKTMINWEQEIIACSWWYPPRATDAEMTADMDGLTSASVTVTTARRTTCSDLWPAGVAD